MGPQVENIITNDIATGDSQFGKVRPNRVRDRLNNRTIKVGGDRYKIGFKGRMMERFQVIAQTDFFNSTILFDSNQTEGNLLSALIHEVLEIINRKYHFKFDHETISALEVALFDVLADNPELLSELLYYAKKIKKG